VTYTREQVLAILKEFREAAAIECDKESVAQKRAEGSNPSRTTFCDYAAKHIRQIDVTRFVIDA
jgi:hypothetical protein